MMLEKETRSTLALRRTTAKLRACSVKSLHKVGTYIATQYTYIYIYSHVILRSKWSHTTAAAVVCRGTS